VYHLGKGEKFTIITVYVDDILVSSKCHQTINLIVSELARQFDVRDLGEVSYCLGIEFSRQNDGITLKWHNNQKRYINEILQRFGMEQCNPVSTPMDVNVKLTKSKEDPSEEVRNLPYRELVECITYLAMTRPDIAFAASCLSQFNNCYTEIHWRAAKRVLRYLKGSINLGLKYSSGLTSLKGFVDSDWGNNEVDRRSQSGFVFLLGGGPITWDSRKQRTVTLSSTEAEYMALTEAVKEAIY